MFATETLAVRGGCAACHGARLVLLSAVFGTEALAKRQGGAA